MKKFITLTALVLFISISAQVKNQDGMNRRPAKDKMEKFEKLNLTDQQKVQIKALFDEKKADHADKPSLTATKKAELSEAEKAEFKAKKEANRQEFDAKIQKILSEEQYKQYKAEREMHHEQKKNSINRSEKSRK